MEVDINRYSRQLAELGFSSMKSLMTKCILIVGLKGVGVETAKNLILSGINKLVIYDNNPIDLYDLSSCYCYSEHTLGQIRSEVAVDHLKLLNPYVSIAHYTGEITEEFISQFHVVFLSGAGLEMKLRISNFCRSHSPNIAFVICENFGAACMGFVDFGHRFVCEDPEGTDPPVIKVTSITNEEAGLVTCHMAHGLQDGDYVVFSDIEGMKELNSFGKVKISYDDMCTFRIGDTRSYPVFVPDGNVQKVKMPVELNFDQYQEALLSPRITFSPPEYRKGKLVNHMHLGFRAVDEFIARHKRYPESLNEADANECYDIANELNSGGKESGIFSVQEVDREVVWKIAKYAKAQVASIATVLGGIMSQEIMKHTGKYSPLNQFMYFDFFEILGPDPEIEESRYKSQVLLLGRKAHDNYRQQSVFLIGAGAVGCEIIKILALDGVRQITVTDDDSIENSNLSRQFLFRSDDIGKNKSQTASKAAKAINGDVEFIPLTLRVCRESENIFNDSFWEGIGLVVVAVDNTGARNYVDSRCIFYEKRLYECGTEGVRGSTHVFIPHKTISYSDIQQVPKAAIPLCTLKTFPYESIHCIEWSRNLFEELFTIGVHEIKKFLEDRDAYLNGIRVLAKSQGLEKLAVLDFLIKIIGSTHKSAVTLGCFGLLEELYFHRISDLLETFPPDCETDGVRFWQKPKKIPNPLGINLEDPTCLAFVKATAALVSMILNTPYTEDPKIVFENYEKQPRFAFFAEVGSEEGLSYIEKKSAALNERLQYFANVKINPLVSQLTPLSFEKDNDLHIDFILASSNLRCQNYQIPETTWFEAKVKAGNIVSALSTTTCVSSGFICAEIYKTQLNLEYEEFRNTYFILTEPFINRYKPDDANKISAKPDDKLIFRPDSFTVWDKIDIVGPMTVQEMVDKVREITGGNLKFFFCDGKGFDLRFGFNEIKDLTVGQFLSGIIEVAHKKMAHLLPQIFDVETSKVLKTPPIRYIL